MNNNNDLIALNNRYFDLKLEDRWAEAEHVLRKIKILLGLDPFI